MHKFVAGIFSVVLFIVALPFVYLYELLGPKLFWPLMLSAIAASAYVLVKRRSASSVDTAEEPVDIWMPPRSPSQEQIRRQQALDEKRAELQLEAQQIRGKRQRIEQRRRTIHTYEVPHDDGVHLEINWPKQLVEVRAAWNEEDWEYVRTWLQKYAYVITNNKAPDHVHAEFKSLMVAFTKVDPLFQTIMADALPIIQAEPNILQSVVVKALSSFKAEDVRYVMYFAAESGLINREKKGRSYLLRMSGQ